MPVEDPKVTDHTLSIVTQYHQAWANRDVHAIMALYHPQVEYHDFSLNKVFLYSELNDYIHASLPKGENEAIHHIDRIRADGHTAFIQYEMLIRGASYRCSEAITVKDDKVFRINEYGVLVTHGKSGSSSAQTPSDNRLGLSARQLAYMAKDLEGYFERSQPYLNPELTLQMVADTTGYTRNQISYFLNQVLGQTFYQYLHQLRIEALIQRLKVSAEAAPSHTYDLDQLAFEAGFKSLSAFYKHFKHHTGMSPKAFIKQLAN